MGPESINEEQDDMQVDGVTSGSMRLGSDVDGGQSGGRSNSTVSGGQGGGWNKHSLNVEVASEMRGNVDEETSGNKEMFKTACNRGIYNTRETSSICYNV